MKFDEDSRVACPSCGHILRETVSSKIGQGILMELRCDKCHVNFYLRRQKWAAAEAGGESE